MEVEKEGYAEGAVFLLSLEGVQDWTQVKQVKHLFSVCILHTRNIFSRKERVFVS
jgi:hypothetical protein